MKQVLIQALQDAKALLTNFCDNASNGNWLESVSLALAKSFNQGQKILICGNGGSYCDAQHFAEEFTGQFRRSRLALPVMVLGDAAHLTCVGNDFGFDHVFARGVEAFGKPGDWLIAITTSGNSPNIIEAVKKAQEKGLHTLGLLGKTGGKLKGVCEQELIIPGKTSDRIQEMHMLILHILIEGVERVLFPEHYEQAQPLCQIAQSPLNFEKSFP